MHCGLGLLGNINTLENECEKADVPGLKNECRLRGSWVKVDKLAWLVAALVLQCHQYSYNWYEYPQHKVHFIC
jgi:hypothetical protein